MSVLTGREIRQRIYKGDIQITPFDASRLNPNSYNVTLHNELMVYTGAVLDMKENNPTQRIIIPENGLILEPGQLYLGRTVERTKSFGVLPMLEGRSSIGRLGMFIHVTAGFGDNGFVGTWTLEITVIRPLKIYPNVEIGQLYYHELIGDQTFYKGGKYSDNNDIQSSMLYKDFEK